MKLLLALLPILACFAQKSKDDVLNMYKDQASRSDRMKAHINKFADLVGDAHTARSYSPTGINATAAKTATDDINYLYALAFQMTELGGVVVPCAQPAYSITGFPLAGCVEYTDVYGTVTTMINTCVIAGTTATVTTDFYSATPKSLTCDPSDYEGSNVYATGPECTPTAVSVNYENCTTNVDAWNTVPGYVCVNWAAVGGCPSSTQASGFVITPNGSCSLSGPTNKQSKSSYYNATSAQEQISYYNTDNCTGAVTSTSKVPVGSQACSSVDSTSSMCVIIA